MNVTFARIGKHPTVGFAFRELARILKKMDPTFSVDGRIYEKVDPSLENVIWLGIDGSVEKKDNDAIRIDVKNGAGVITGSQERAVLIAAYRFLKEMGCRFLRPGTEGEVIPQKTLTRADFTAQVQEEASYRHRGVCIEGSVSYEHVANMVDFLPKVGMNGYFMQFFAPTAFFKNFYNNNLNPHLQNTPVTDEDVAHMWAGIEEEIQLRSLDYHATGHGWTCAPFNIVANGWFKQSEDEIPPETIEVMAQMDSRRGLFKGTALNTNLCYSNPEVRSKMADAIVEYCKEHSNVNFLHFWLADSQNNHCECAECQKKIPSDFYVMTLNELDEKLTAAGIDTKIVCLIYKDLLWAPTVEKIRNPDRFVLMFAPISRTYTNAFADAELNAKVELAPYKRNRNVMPKSVAENLARLAQWQKEQLNGDSFDFDYHLMWDHILNPGYHTIAKILHKDMANLDQIGLNGMMSCQGQRVFFPTGLPFYAMADALWNKESRFEDVCAEYFTAAFGEDGKKVETYLAEIDRLIDPVYLRKEKPEDPEGYAANMAELKKHVERFEDEIQVKKEVNSSWHLLSVHAGMVKEHADMLTVFLGPDSTPEKREAAKEKLLNYFYSLEPEFIDVFDTDLYHRIFNRYLDKFNPDIIQ